MESKHAAAYIALAAFAAGLTEFGVLLGQGQVPIPSDFAWAVPVLSAVIVAITTRLPSAGQGE